MKITMQGDLHKTSNYLYYRFTCKFYLYGPVTSVRLSRQYRVDAYTDMPDNTDTTTEITVTPNPASADADDDFGFNETFFL